jgi:FAD/FMN-containing dehydrogenase
MTVTSKTWTNWVGNQSFEAQDIITVSTEAEVQRWVRHAAENKIGVRTFGTGHSFTPIVETPGILLDTAPMRGVTKIDPTRRLATALPKTSVGDFGPPLWEAGLSLSNQGDIDTQAIAGAVATATHGSGKRYTNFSAMLAGARFVDGQGNLVTVSDTENADVLPALQTSIGLLGMMTELTVKVAPKYALHGRHLVQRYDAVMERFDELVERHRAFGFFWMPSDRSAALYNLDGAGEDDCLIRVFDELPDPDTPFAQGAHDERVGPAYQVYPMVYDPNFHEVEYFLPIAHAHDIIREMRKLMKRWFPLSVYPLEIRTVKGDEAWMSPNYKRDNLVVSISGEPGVDYWAYLRACDIVFAEFGGRPHWGKMHFMTADRLERLFPRYSDFVAMRRRFDPDGTFLNPHTRALFA